MSKNIPFYVFNIKLQTNKSTDDRKKEYIRLITELSNGKFFLQVGKMEAITMYSVLGAKRDPDPKYIYGHAAKGTYISGDEINILKH